MGDLLPACYDDWVLDELAKLRVGAYGALVRLTEEAARDDYKDMIRHALAIQGILNEAVFLKLGVSDIRVGPMRARALGA